MKVSAINSVHTSAKSSFGINLIDMDNGRCGQAIKTATLDQKANALSSIIALKQIKPNENILLTRHTKQVGSKSFSIFKAVWASSGETVIELVDSGWCRCISKIAKELVYKL